MSCHTNVSILINTNVMSAGLDFSDTCTHLHLYLCRLLGDEIRKQIELKEKNGCLRAYL